MIEDLASVDKKRWRPFHPQLNPQLNVVAHSGGHLRRCRVGPKPFQVQAELLGVAVQLIGYRPEAHREESVMKGPEFPLPSRCLRGSRGLARERMKVEFHLRIAGRAQRKVLEDERGLLIERFEDSMER